MHKLGYHRRQRSTTKPERKRVRARAHAPLYAVEAPYVAEMARLDLRARFGPAAEAAGYKVYTTIDGRLQTAANRALRLGLVEYDRRQGWRGPIGHADVEGRTKEEQFEGLLDEYSSVGMLLPAVVVSAHRTRLRACSCARADSLRCRWEGLSWARKEEATRRRRRRRRSLLPAMSSMS